MISYYAQGWKRSFDFNGKATRNQFWWFVLWDIILNLGLLFSISSMEQLSFYFLSLEETVPSAIFFTNFCDSLTPILSSLFALIFLSSMIPRIAIAVRRLHDTGRSGFWIFLQLVPLLKLMLIFWYAQPSKDSQTIRINDFNLK